ncbi:MAG: sulfite exporter TauE/SafE family protein [Bacteroidota bacterium]
MQPDQIVLVLLGALAGGVVNGLTGFGTAITAMGLWLYAISPPVAASLAIICSVVAQLQTLPMIWGSIEWRRVLPFVLPGLLGVPVGTWLLPQVDPRTFRICVGLFLVGYPGYVLARKTPMRSTFGGRGADGAAGFAGGVLGGLMGFSGVPPIVWTDIRGWSKEQRRTVLQVFNVSILAAALLSHAVSGLLTSQVGLAAATALPGTIGGAWAGAVVYRRLRDRGYQRAVMMLLLASGLVLLGASW